MFEGSLGRLGVRGTLAVVLVLAAARCGTTNNYSTPDGGDAGGADSLHNECGGQRDLRFAGAEAHVGDACGECGDGKVICGSPDALVCVGALQSLPDCSGPSGGTDSNACGGFEALRYASASAAPGDACGECHSGVLACVAPNQLGCIGEEPDSCGGAGGAGGGVMGEGGAGGDASAPGAGGADDYGCLPDQLTYLGEPALPGQTCGPCGDGLLRCINYTGIPLICSGATPADYCQTPNDAPNECGGTGRLTWGDEPASPKLRCGACGRGILTCATKNELACVSTLSPYIETSTCAHSSPNNECAIPASAYTAAPAHEPPSPPAQVKPANSSQQNLGIPVTALVFNPFDQLLYATVPGSFGANGNGVVVVNPATTAVVKYISTGSEPKALALSDDGAALWVVNTGSASLRKVDTASLTADAEYPLAAGFLPDRVAVLPGGQDSVVVGGASSIMVFDSGVPRPAAADANTFPFTVTNSHSLAYGYDSNDTGFGFATFCINQNGIFAQRVEQDVISGFVSALVFNDGVLYGGDGSAYDIARKQVIGKYPGAKAIAVDSAARRIFLASASGIAAYDLDNFSLAGTDTAFKGQYNPAQLVRWGRYGFAFSAGSDYVASSPTLYVGQSTLIP